MLDCLKALLRHELLTADVLYTKYYMHQTRKCGSCLQVQRHDCSLESLDSITREAMMEAAS